jgi:hypothetical protein
MGPSVCAGEVKGLFMENHRGNSLIKWVAIGQLIPIFLYPVDSLKSISPIILGLVLAFFVFLGYYVWNRRVWAKTLTIFLQGFNIIARIMLTLSNAAEPLKSGGGAHWSFIFTGLVAIALSGLILYRFDAPDIEVEFAG